MSRRRILSLWFPRLPVERRLRRRIETLPPPFAVMGDRNGAQVVVSVNAEAEAAGVLPGQPLRDATAICPGLETSAADETADAAFLTVLRRWAGKFSPWVAEDPPTSLMLDLTGCAHLFGGEAALLQEVEADCAALGLTVRAGVADTPGAAWALARYAGRDLPMMARNGDSIEQEAHATRSRASKRRGWEKGGAAPHAAPVGGGLGVVAATGQMRQALAPLPIAALRLPDDIVASLSRLGLRRVGDILGLPRASLSRRFGPKVLRRLDQALGLEPEPISAARAPLHFAVRLTLPDPIGLLEDVEAGVDRLLPPLMARLRDKGRGALKVMLQAFRTDGSVEVVTVGLSRAADEVDRIRPLLALKLPRIDAGFGIDCLRLSAVLTEPLVARQHRGHLDAEAGRNGGVTDLINKLGARLGMEAVTRLHPAESHIPEKSALVLAAAWSEPAPDWPEPRAPRPLILFPCERMEGEGRPPTRLRWRRREMEVVSAVGPERITPEWWLDDPAWRSGARDYWRVEVEGGDRLWIFFAHGGEVSGGWFCQGMFA